MRTFLGIDLGDNCGWCAITSAPNIGTTVLSGCWQFKPTRFDTASVRYDMFGRQLDAWLSTGVDEVAYEAVMAHAGIHAAHVYGGYMAKLLEKCELYGIPCFHYPVGTIKLWATGKGNADKKAMKHAAGIYLNRSISNDNEADAIHIARMLQEGIRYEKKTKKGKS